MENGSSSQGCCEQAPKVFEPMSTRGGETWWSSTTVHCMWQSRKTWWRADKSASIKYRYPLKQIAITSCLPSGVPLLIRTAVLPSAINRHSHVCACFSIRYSVHYFWRLIGTIDSRWSCTIRTPLMASANSEIHCRRSLQHWKCTSCPTECMQGSRWQ